MSIRAVNWALSQRTDGPSAQIVLFVIADSANEHGVTRHANPDYICEKTRQSRGTVFRRLDELERVGLLTRFVKHLPDGRRQYEIRLNLEVMANYKVDKDRTINIFAFDDDACAAPVRQIAPDGAAVDASESAPAERDDDGPESQAETEGECKFETHRVSPVTLTESHSCNSQNNPPESRSPPKPPLAPADGPQGLSDQEQDDGVPFHRFQVNYPIPILKPELARTTWSGMTDTEREQAVEGARGYGRFVEREKRRAMDAHRWLRERLWGQFAGDKPAGGRVFVAEGSAAEAAWTIAYQLRGFREIPYFARSIRNGERVVSVPSEYPPLGRELPPFDRSTWVFIPQGDNRWWAWRERLVKAFGEGVRFLSRHTVEGVECAGAWFPSDWPPPKGTGPPDASLSEDDLAELAKTG